MRVLRSEISGSRKIEIVEGDVATLLQFSPQVPEFSPPYLTMEEYQRRVAGRRALILFAVVDGEIAGFKAGYEREDTFYSWLGAVFPAYRRMGIARMLAEVQEREIKGMGFPTVTFKTRNCHRNMLLFAIGNGFHIIGFEAREDPLQNRILLKKSLL